MLDNFHPSTCFMLSPKINLVFIFASRGFYFFMIVSLWSNWFWILCHCCIMKISRQHIKFCWHITFTLCIVFWIKTIVNHSSNFWESAVGFLGLPQVFNNVWLFQNKFFNAAIYSPSVVRSWRSRFLICGESLLLLSSAVLSSKRSVTWASVGVLKIFGGAGVLSITSCVLLPFGLFSNVPFVVRKVILFSTTYLSTLILLFLLNTESMMVGSSPYFCSFSWYIQLCQ